MALSKVGLRVGDVLLQPLNCWSCNLIEAEEKTIFSHVGLVISDSPIMVAEALGSVRRLPLEAFDSRTEKKQKVLVIRFKDPAIQKRIHSQRAVFLDVFANGFEGKKYDKEFLWDNQDEAGGEKYYCSELISKIFLQVLDVKTPIKRMHFNQNRELWGQFFKGNIPDDQWGNSPADFERSELFEKVGEL